MKIFVLNVGSSSCKSALFEVFPSKELKLLWKEKLPLSNLKDLLKKEDLSQIRAAGHRVVLGGEKYQKPVFIDQEVKHSIAELSALAPLHNTVNLEGIETLQAILPSIPHVAVFDTAFHTTMPSTAFTYAIPKEFRDLGIRRYGFHGISHEYCAKQAAKLLKKELTQIKMVTCHLGNGSSLTAILNGVSIDTTMGFTPLEGVIMGTRSGSIDPGILLYLLRENKVSVDDLDHALNFSSGLKGLCGYSDMQDVLRLMKQNNPAACLAYDMLVHSLVKNIGSLISVLGGLDVLVFAGGIGENCSELRESICQKLAYLNVFVDQEANLKVKEDQKISHVNSHADVLVIHTKEELSIAQAVLETQLIVKSPFK